MLSCLSKIIERLIYSRIKRFCIERKILRNQVAATSGCEKAIEALLNYAFSKITHRATFLIFFDVTKAFDRVVRVR
jgi:hypothetical protein